MSSAGVISRSPRIGMVRPAGAQDRTGAVSSTSPRAAMSASRIPVNALVMNPISDTLADPSGRA